MPHVSWELPASCSELQMLWTDLRVFVCSKKAKSFVDLCYLFSFLGSLLEVNARNAMSIYDKYEEVVSFMETSAIFIILLGLSWYPHLLKGYLYLWF